MKSLTKTLLRKEKALSKKSSLKQVMKILSLSALLVLQGCGKWTSQTQDKNIEKKILFCPEKKSDIPKDILRRSIESDSTLQDLPQSSLLIKGLDDNNQEIFYQQTKKDTLCYAQYPVMTCSVADSLLKNIGSEDFLQYIFLKDSIKESSLSGLTIPELHIKNNNIRNILFDKCGLFSKHDYFKLTNDSIDTYYLFNKESPNFEKFSLIREFVNNDYSPSIRYFPTSILESGIKERKTLCYEEYQGNPEKTTNKWVEEAKEKFEDAEDEIYKLEEYFEKKGCNINLENDYFIDRYRKTHLVLDNIIHEIEAYSWQDCEQSAEKCATLTTSNGILSLSEDCGAVTYTVFSSSGSPVASGNIEQYGQVNFLDILSNQVSGMYYIALTGVFGEETHTLVKP